MQIFYQDNAKINLVINWNFTKIRCIYFNVYWDISINNTLIVKGNGFLCRGVTAWSCLNAYLKRNYFRWKRREHRYIHLPLSYDMTSNVFPNLRENGILWICRGKKHTKKHDLHLLCQFIFYNLSETVNLELSRTHFNLGFNFFSQQHFARANESSKISCSDLQLASLLLLSRLRTKSYRPWSYLQPLNHFIFPTSSGCERKK